MQWNSDAIILSVKKFKERAVIVTLLTEEKGVYAGLIRYATSPTMRSCLQVGNHVYVLWSARLEEHLGDYKCELETAIASKNLQHRGKLHAIASLATILQQTIPEGEGKHLYRVVFGWLSTLHVSDTWLRDYVSLEMHVLQELGYGLDLSCCASTGCVEDLTYISPRTGRAVSQKAGAPYHGKLFPLPAFLRDQTAKADTNNIYQGLKILWHFYDRFVYEPHQLQMPIARGQLMHYIETSLKMSKESL